MQVPLIESPLSSMDLREFTGFRSLIHEQTGIWLRDGKQIMLAARLSRRLRHHGMESFADYYEHVKRVPADSPEMREFINCVTTNKTSFFREKHHFDYLTNKVVPELRSAAARRGSRTIRIWSAASSTGEEAYTIGMTLLEALNGADQPKPSTATSNSAEQRKAPAATSLSNHWKIEIFASDIDTKVLDTARRAVYAEESVEPVSDALRRKYFLRGKDDMQGQVKVKQEVTRLVEFKRINLMDRHWPVEGSFDVIFFRNALIYFKQDTQDVFLRKMIQYLKPRSYLFLGNSEHIPWLHGILEPLNQTMFRVR